MKGLKLFYRGITVHLFVFVKHHPLIGNVFILFAIHWTSKIFEICVLDFILIQISNDESWKSDKSIQERFKND